MDQTIMILGGYGQVGTCITKQLAEQKENQVHIIIAGRSMEKAKQLAEQYPDRCEARAVDVQQIKNENLEGIDTVVMCFETCNYEVLSHCILQKVNYIDITPSNDIIEQLLTLESEVAASKIKVILGVGIAPGVSNLLAAHGVRQLERVHEIRSYLMLGVGEAHGKDAVKWLVNQLHGSYPVQTDGGTVMTRSFTKSSKITVEQESSPVFEAANANRMNASSHETLNTKQHDFTRIDLADQYINRRLYPQAISNSWFAYDMNLVTKMMRAMNRMGMFHLSSHKRMNRIYQKMFQYSMGLAKRLHIGSDRYASIIYLSGIKDGKETTIRLSVSGNCNSQLTASVAASMALRISQAESRISYACEIADIDDLGIPYTSTL